MAVIIKMSDIKSRTVSSSLRKIIPNNDGNIIEPAVDVITTRATDIQLNERILETIEPITTIAYKKEYENVGILNCMLPPDITANAIVPNSAFTKLYITKLTVLGVNPC